MNLMVDRGFPFLDMLLRRREDDSLDVSVYRKPMHMDRYLHFESYHLTDVERGLRVRARGIISTQDNLQRKLTT